jgi:hypothetical protein
VVAEELKSKENGRQKNKHISHDFIPRARQGVFTSYLI